MVYKIGIEVVLPSFLFPFHFILLAKIVGLWQIPANMSSSLFASFHGLYQVWHDFFFEAQCWYLESQFLAISHFYNLTVQRIWEKLTERGSDSKLLF